MSWSGPSLVGRFGDLQYDSHPSRTRETAQYHLVHHNQHHPHSFGGYRHHHVANTPHCEELMLAPLQSTHLIKHNAIGRSDRSAASCRQTAAERKGIAISDIVSPPVARPEHIPRTPRHLEVDLSPTAIVRSNVGQWPPHLRRNQHFTPVNSISQFDKAPGVTAMRQHQPGGSLDPNLWTIPEPDARPSSRLSGNGEGPSRSRCNRSLSSARSPSSSQDRSLEALSPFLSPVSPCIKPQLSAAPSDYNFTLIFRQQPLAARACGLGDRDRRTIDPPPILELKITNKTDGYPVQDLSNMLVLHCDLRNANGDSITHLPQSTAEDSRPVTAMMGNHVASPFPAKDERGVAGTFFVLPDLSCRYPGKYRLHFSLLRLKCQDMPNGQNAVSILSEPFTAYTAKDFPGMRESTPLLKQLRKQGLSVGIKKGSEARKMRSRMRRSSGQLGLDEADDHDIKTEARTMPMRDSPGSDRGIEDEWARQGKKRKTIA